MRTTVLLAAAMAAGVAAASDAATLDEVRERGELRCGVSTGLTGFAVRGPNGNWDGFDVSMCRAIAAAVLGDPQAVDFVETTPQSYPNALAGGGVDVLASHSTWTFDKDVSLKFSFAGINYYDAQAFMVHRDLGVTSARDLEEPRICLVEGDDAHANLDLYFERNNMTYTPVWSESLAEAQELYLGGECDALSTDRSVLAATRATFENPADHVILSETVSKEPHGPLVRHGDEAWGDIVRWTLNALVAAEELGITSANVGEMAEGTGNPEIDRLLGTQGGFGEALGLDADWAQRAINAVGNYGEIFERYIGENTPVGLARGLNAQWENGGLQYALPFR